MTTKKKLRTMTKLRELKMKDNPNSRGLDRPRSERGEYVMTSTVSVGMPVNSGGDESKRMDFKLAYAQNPEHAWGRQTKELRKQDKPNYQGGAADAGRLARQDRGWHLLQALGAHQLAEARHHLVAYGFGRFRRHVARRWSRASGRQDEPAILRIRERG